METFIDFVREWGYWAVFFGAMIEGESVILTAGFLSHAGHLNLGKIMLISFLGTFFADQALFQVGYHYGPKFLDRFPRLKPTSDRVFELLHKWDIWYILSFRFIYGVRIMSPLVIGTARVDPKRFLLLNFIAAVIWSILSCGAGYLLGDAFESIMGDLSVNKAYFALVPALMIVSLGGIVTLFQKVRKNITKKEPSDQ